MQRLHLRMSSFDKDMKGHYGKTSYSSLCFLQGIICCFINIFLSFPKYLKKIFLYLLHSNEDLRSTIVYPSLQTIDIPSSCINYIHQDPSSELYNAKGQSYELNETKTDLIPLEPNPVPSKILDRYRSLKFPSILHSFPPKHYKYLPMFDG